jgi:choline dehydrogenase-like flavoprotein
MTRTLLPRAVGAGARVLPSTRVTRLRRRHGRVAAVDCVRRHPDGSSERVEIVCDHVFACAGAVQTPALLQRSGIVRGVGTGLRMHPTIKIVARFARPIDHDVVPMHRVVEFSPFIAIGGSASRRGHVGLALADAGAVDSPALADWASCFVYYAAIRSDGVGRVRALPGLASPLVTYRLTDADLARLARGLVHLGELLLAAGAVELYPSIDGGPVVRHVDELVRWWDAVDRRRTSLMTVHLTSTVRMGEDPRRAAADSFGVVRGVANLRVNDASLVPDAPGVNPQASIMTIALRNAEHFLAAQ